MIQVVRKGRRPFKMCINNKCKTKESWGKKTRKFKTKTQELKEEVCFITAVAWDKQAETCNQYLHKGSPLFVEGRLQSRSWDDATSGQKRSVIEVRVERVQFLGAPGGSKGLAPVPAAAAEEQHVVPEPSTETAWLEESEGEHNEN